MLDSQQILMNWPKIKTQILTHWNRLSESEVEGTHGNANSLKNLITETYGGSDNFENEYEELCGSLIDNHTNSSYNRIQPVKATAREMMSNSKSAESDLVENAMDKSRDDMYLAGPFGVTRSVEMNKKNVTVVNDLDHKLEEEILEPNLTGLEVTDYLKTPFKAGMATTENTTKHRNNKRSTTDEFKTNQSPHSTKRGYHIRKK